METLKLTHTMIRFEGITIWRRDMHDKEDDYDYRPFFEVPRLRDPLGKPFYSSSLLDVKLAILKAQGGHLKGWRLVSWEH